MKKDFPNDYLKFITGGTKNEKNFMCHFNLYVHFGIQLLQPARKVYIL